MPPLRESMALLFSPDKRRSKHALGSHTKTVKPSFDSMCCYAVRGPVDQDRQKFRDLVNELLTSPMEAIIPTVTSNVPFLLSTNSSIFMQVTAAAAPRVLIPIKPLPDLSSCPACMSLWG